MPPEHNFTITDDDGQPHAYTVRLHPASEGRILALQIGAMGVEAFAGLLVTAALAAVRGKNPMDVITADQLTVAIASLPKVIQAITPQMIDALLKHTDRDGRPLMGRPDFDAAYSGNYGELSLALWEVVKANRFLPVSRISAMLQSKPKAAAATPGSKGP